VGFVVDEVALEQVFSEYFGFSANSHSIDCSGYFGYEGEHEIKLMITHITKITRGN
jgi:hypothetical protein